MRIPIKLSSTYLQGVVNCLNNGKFAYLTNANGIVNIYGFIPYKTNKVISVNDFTTDIIDQMEKALSCGDDIQVKIEHETTITIIKLDRKLLGKVIKV